nr:MAG TPA: hypothetical protein [Caudoviricetes sp.]
MFVQTTPLPRQKVAVSHKSQLSVPLISYNHTPIYITAFRSISLTSL